MVSNVHRVLLKIELDLFRFTAQQQITCLTRGHESDVLALYVTNVLECWNNNEENTPPKP